MPHPQDNHHFENNIHNDNDDCHRALSPELALTVRLPADAPKKTSNKEDRSFRFDGNFQQSLENDILCFG
jgi:hypothetical protein